MQYFPPNPPHSLLAPSACAPHPTHWWFRCSGRSSASGVGTLCLFFALYQKRLILRISSLPLRENWGTPTLWLQILCLITLLSRPPRPLTALDTGARGQPRQGDKFV
eukprot:GHVN01069202.1.p1 GENE.GHVN01069202.1~~GHVN01069202.1.p1  ORF type:complete len:107 (+),score=12.83 GHVN01069202.1:153-473(+)